MPSGVPVEMMSPGSSDKAQLRAKGQQSYGIGPAATTQDKVNHSSHSDVERLAEASIYEFVEFVWRAVTGVAVSGR